MLGTLAVWIFWKYFGKQQFRGKFCWRWAWLLTVQWSKRLIGTVNFAACDNYRPHFTKITKIWQERSPIRKSSITCDLEKLSSFCCTRLCSIPGRKISFTDCVDEDSWDEENSHTACSRNFLCPRSSSSLAFRLFIVLNLDSFHEIFFRGARIRRRMTFNTHEN